MEKNLYVTFNIRLTPYLGGELKHYAVECDNENDAREVASDVYSMDGVKYVRIKRSGKPVKGTKIMTKLDYFKVDFTK